MLITSVLDSMADELLLLEIDGSFDQIEPFENFYDFAEDEVESHPYETVRWGYRVPCPGVRYYTFE